MSERAPRDAAARLADVEAVFSAVAHAQRRQILLVLLYRGERVPAGDIAKRFSCAWPTTTRHLGVLRDARDEGTARLRRRRLGEIDQCEGVAHVIPYAVRSVPVIGPRRVRHVVMGRS